MNSIQETIGQLTTNVRDLASKPLLRPVLEAELLKLRYEPEEVKRALDKTFKVTYQ